MSIENVIRTVTTFEFKVYDKGGNKDYLFDATPEQCCLYLWKKHPTAHITEMFEFGIQEKYIKRIDRAILKTFENPYAQGTDEDLSIRAERIKNEKENIEKFKNKHNIE